MARIGRCAHQAARHRSGSARGKVPHFAGRRRPGLARVSPPPMLSSALSDMSWPRALTVKALHNTTANLYHLEVTRT